MRNFYYPQPPPYAQPPYPGAPWRQPPPAAPVPAKPGRPWPLRAINRWMTISLGVITLLAVLLALLAPHTISAPPSTAGYTLRYHSDMTKNDGNWADNETCQFSSSGYTVTATDPNLAVDCPLLGGYQNFLLRVDIVKANQIALIGFLNNDHLAIFGSGRFLFYQTDPVTGKPLFRIPQTSVGTGSTALHPTSLGVSERVNEIAIQVQQQTYSFYANGQLLATYFSPTLEQSGPISLGTDGDSTAEFSNLAIYVPR